MYDRLNGWKTPFILLIFNISISPHLCRSDHAWDSVQYMERYLARYNIDWTQYNGRPPSTTTWSLHTCVTYRKWIQIQRLTVVKLEAMVNVLLRAIVFLFLVLLFVKLCLYYDVFLAELATNSFQTQVYMLASRCHNVNDIDVFCPYNNVHFIFIVLWD